MMETLREFSSLVPELDFGAIPDWISVAFSLLAFSYGGFVAVNHRYRIEDRRQAVDVLARLELAPDTVERKQLETAQLDTSIDFEVTGAILDWLDDITELRNILSLLPLSNRLIWFRIIRSLPKNWEYLLAQVAQSAFLSSSLPSTGHEMGADELVHDWLIAGGKTDFPQESTEQWVEACRVSKKHLIMRLNPSIWDRCIRIRINNAKNLIQLGLPNWRDLSTHSFASSWPHHRTTATKPFVQKFVAGARYTKSS